MNLGSRAQMVALIAYLGANHGRLLELQLYDLKKYESFIPKEKTPKLRGDSYKSSFNSVNSKRRPAYNRRAGDNGYSGHVYSKTRKRYKQKRSC